MPIMDGRQDVLKLHDNTVRTVLPNGLTLLTRTDRSAAAVAIVTHVKAGYFNERDDQVGISHVLEHMYFKGTSAYGPGELARQTKAHGGYLNAHTIYDHTTYYSVLPAASFTVGLDLQFDAFANAAIDERELAKELEVIIQEVKRKRDRPGAVTVELLYSILYDRHRIRRWRMGEEDALRAFTRSDVLAFKDMWYQPNNTILAVVGDVDPEVVFDEVLKRYGSMSGSTSTDERGPHEIAAPGLRYREIFGDYKQQHIAFGWRVPSLMHSDSAVLELAGVIHGSGRASRLYRSVRERELATSVSAWNYTAGDVGAFVAMVECPPAKSRAAAIASWQEFSASRTEGVCSSEVKRAQQIIEARWLRRLESMEGQALYLASWESLGGLGLASNYYEALQLVDANDVQAAMQNHLSAPNVSFVSCRPESSNPFVTDVHELQEAVIGSTYIPRAAVLTPSHPLPAVSPVSGGVQSPTLVEKRTSRELHPIATLNGQSGLLGGISVYRTHAGVPIMIIPRDGAVIAHIGVFVGNGAASGSGVKEGLARLCAHTLLKGTFDRSGTEIAEIAESMGSSIGVSTGLERTSWTMTVPTRHVQPAIALLGDVLQRPAFKEESINTERTLALEEIVRMRDDMYRWPLRLALEAAFGSHPYARSIGGNAESLVSIERGDVLDWHEHFVLRAPSLIAVTGSVDPQQVAEWCEQLFPTLEYSDKSAFPPVAWPEGKRAVGESRRTRQSALALVFPGPSRTDPMRFPMRVLAAMSTGLGGRLFTRLRDEKSLAYTVNAHSVEQSASGAFATYIATSPSRVDEARDELLSEIDRFGVSEASTEEVRRACSYLSGTETIARQSGAHLLAEYVDAWMSGESLDEPLKESEHIETVTPDDIQLAARTFLRVGSQAEALIQGTDDLAR